ncbi:MAG: DUF4925 domain-containing protein [Bacteroides sp.]|nr:DUF4925 domain-containing protein [Bacteroides sp.]
MKFKLIHALAMASLMTTFSSCSNDDPIAPGSSLEEKTYTGTDGLSISLNGTSLIGKVATFTPATDGTATVTLAGEPIEMDAIMGMITKAEHEQPTLALPTAGVLPGSSQLIIPVELKGDADNCTFDGKGETDYCTYFYSGAATAETFEFNLTDVKLKNTSLAGTWTLPELYEINPDWGTEEANIYNVARVVWQSENGIEVMPGWPMPVESILGMTLAIPMIGEGDNLISPIEMLTVVLKSVTFSEDGNVTAEYLDSKDMSKGVIKSPAGLAQYVITSEGNLRLFLNPAAIIANTVTATKSCATRAADISMIVESLMQQLIPMLSQGVPVSYGKALTDSEGNLNEDPDIMSFFLGTETLLPLLKAVSPLLADEDFVNSIVEEARKDPNMGYMADMLPGILQSLPEVINTTSKIEIGINLKK